jgi:hypothetical protein
MADPILAFTLGDRRHRAGDRLKAARPPGPTSHAAGHP